MQCGKVEHHVKAPATVHVAVRPESCSTILLCDVWIGFWMRYVDVCDMWIVCDMCEICGLVVGVAKKTDLQLKRI